MPAVAELRRPAQRRLAVASHPDRRVGLLHGLRLTAERIKAVEPAGERGRTLGPERLEDSKVLVGHRGAPSASNSSRIHPTPTPTVTRPFESTSMVASAFAVSTGLR